MTFDQLIQHVGISKERLMQQCSEEHLRQISGLIGNWLKYAEGLRLPESKILEIRNDQLRDAEMKAQEVLMTWHRANGFMASYKTLINVALSFKNAELAKKICGLLEGVLTWQYYSYIIAVAVTDY